MPSKVRGIAEQLSTSAACEKQEGISWNALVAMKADLDKEAEAHKALARTVFETVFGADSDRGDVVILPKKYEGVYPQMCRLLIPTIMNRIKLDKTGAIDTIVVLNGDYIVEGIGEFKCPN